MNGKKNDPIKGIEDDEDGSMILEEEIDENYEPTQEEIIEYAQFLGMDLEKDKEFFYIAREGLKAPLPDIWKPAKNRKGDIYYINLETKKTQWEHPCDEFYKKLFQDAKRKKETTTQQKPISKFKSNLPLGNNAAVSPKYNALPLIKEVGSQQRIDTNGSSENQNTLSLNNNDFSIDGISVPFSNKKAGDKSNPTQSQKLGSILNELKDDFTVNDDFLKIDKEYEDKIYILKKEKDNEAKEIITKNKSVEKEQEGKLRESQSKDLENLKIRLIEKAKTSNQTFEEDKRKIKQDLIAEYEKKTDIALKRADQDHISMKRKIDLQEAREIDKAVAEEEEQIVKNFEKKIVDLSKAKKDLLNEQAKVYEKKSQREKEEHRQIEEEKRRIEQEYLEQLNEFGEKELANQKLEIENYKKKLQIQMTEEKSALAIAEKQRKSLALAKETELKEEYDHKLEQEKEQVDKEMTLRLKEYEQAERSKKDKIIGFNQTAELKSEKDKKKSDHQRELDKLKENYKRRLATYETQLKEKYDNEKKLVDQEVTNILEKYRIDVENIKTNLNTKEDILFQIKKTQEKNDEMNREVAELTKKAENQKKENDELVKKLDNLKSKMKNQSKVRGEIFIKELERRIDEAERTRKDLKKPQLGKESQYFFGNQLSNTKPSTTPIRGSTSFVKILESVEEIKSMMMTKTDEKERLNTTLTPKKSMSSRIASPKTKMRTSTTQDTFEYDNSILRLNEHSKWTKIYMSELENIDQLKERVEECKTMLTERQTNLIESQQKFKKNLQDYKHSSNKSSQMKQGLKKLKSDLDDQVQKLDKNINELKKAEKNLDMKENLLTGLGRIIKRPGFGDFEIDEVKKIYDKYLDIDVKIPNAGIEKHLRFYENWKDIFESQLALDNELSESENNSNLPSKRMYVSEAINRNIKTEMLEKRFDLLSPKTTPQNYDSLLKVLDLQTKSEVFIPEVLMTRSITEAKESRSKVTSLLNSHLDWLKDIKYKLNNQIYDKSSKDLQGVF